MFDQKTTPACRPGSKGKGFVAGRYEDVNTSKARFCQQRQGLLSAALKYAAQGWPIFPVDINKRALCRWKDAATTDETQIRRLFTNPAVAGIGLPTGSASGLFVIDRDKKNGVDGIEACKELEKQHGPLPQTMQQRTGSGGDQLFFLYPDGAEIKNSASALAGGIDVRAEGGYVVIPPSVNSAGKYKWLNDLQPAFLPLPWLELLQKQKHESKKTTAHAPATATGPQAQTGISTAYGKKALRAEAETLRKATEGTRNDALNRAAFAIGQLVSGGELEENEALTLLRSAASEVGLEEREIEKTLGSGFNAGLQHPRSAPVLSLYNDPDNDQEHTDHSLPTFLRPHPCPWRVMPAPLVESLQQLARSCATSPTQLLGATCVLLASVVGRSFNVKAKESWLEPEIFWFLDVKSSGKGKTPAVNLLSQPVKKKQSLETKEYKKALKQYREQYEEWKINGSYRDESGNDIEEKPHEPEKPPKWYTTNFTIEGLHSKLDGHSTGGLAVLQGEGSSFLSSQNQYKNGSGSDRESMLELHDGTSASIFRASKEDVEFDNPRVQFYGGIQPEILKELFNSKNGIYKVDGTLYRMLMTYEKSDRLDATSESWSEENKKTWESILDKAEAQFRKVERDENGEIITCNAYNVVLSQEALEHFLNWRNNLDEYAASHLPDFFHGFMSKSYGYALRFAGILDLLHCYATDSVYTKKQLTVDDIQRAIELTEFFLSQSWRIAQLFSNCSIENSQNRLIARALKASEKDVEEGKLGVSFLLAKYNEIASEEMQIVTKNKAADAKKFGNVLRLIGFDFWESKYKFKDKNSVTCIKCNAKLRAFIEENLREGWRK